MNDFDVTWWAELIRYNTTLPTFILKPASILVEIFDLQYEVLMVYALYDSMEARTVICLICNYHWLTICTFMVGCSCRRYFKSS